MTTPFDDARQQWQARLGPSGAQTHSGLPLDPLYATDPAGDYQRREVHERGSREGGRGRGHDDERLEQR